jgi:Mn-dependent DtxR family transcriptional regulator
MSRKYAKKSNIKIGIFSDKSAEYNQAILETLLPKEATAWQIAEALQKKRNPAVDKEARLYRTQKVYSVIQRKKGRLSELKNKGYIEERDGKWSLTKKGLIALYVEKPDLVTNQLQAKKHILLEQFKKEVSSLPDETVTRPLGIQIDLTKTKPALAKINPTELFAVLFEEARALLSEGIELDRISEKDLLNLALLRAAPHYFKF